MLIRAGVATSCLALVAGVAGCDSSSPSEPDVPEVEASLSLVVRGLASRTIEMVGDTGGITDTLTTVADGSIREHHVSPDGEYVAFITQTSGPDFDRGLHFMEIDGGSPVEVPGLVDSPWYPSWSPDGERLVFGQANQARLYVVDRDGSGLQTIVDRPLFGRNPHWSRNSDWIAYVGGEVDSPESEGLWIVRPDGSEATQVTEQRTYLDLTPRISPNGEWIAFEAENELHIVRSDGTDERQLTSTPSEGDWHPRWSPDGTRIAHQADGGALWMIEIRDVTTGEVTASIDYDRLNDHDVLFPAWSPDGEWIGFTVARLDWNSGAISGWMRAAVASSREHTTWSETSMPTVLAPGRLPAWRVDP